ncbi:MAG: cytochrome c [Pseudomonadales bacterium]
MKKVFITLSITSLLGALAIGLFLYSGLFDVSATTPHSSLTKWLMTSTMHASVARQGKGVEVPDLSDEGLILEGINDFEAMCVACHGTPGKSPNSMGQGLNPSAPDLQESAQHHTPGELFWIIKHGIKMTGMPAWGVSHDDEALWPVVALLMELPDLNAESYASLRKQAKGVGHHAESGVMGKHAHESAEIERSMKQPEITHEHDDHEY